MDSFELEQAEERRELLKGLHPKLKVFWSSIEGSVLRDSGRYGAEFPSFWQELETWVHLKVMQKIFFIVCERRERGLEVTEADVLQIEGTLQPKTEAETEAEAEAEAESLAEAPTTGADDNPEKKRRKRWETDDAYGTAAPAAAAVAAAAPSEGAPSEGAAATGQGEIPPPPPAAKSRRNRWGGDGLVSMAGLGAGSSREASQEVIQQTMVLKLQLQQLNDRLLNVVQEAALAEQNPDRSPSPPPKYDSQGKRTNTREVRLRESLTKDRARLIDELVKLNPLFQPPADSQKAKPTRKVFIPFREYPGYNFIGLIIGPRGNTQKKMEQETSCKISIRGKGSVKEGSKGRSSQSEVTAEDEDLHVFITGENDESLDAAEKLVRDLLRPIDDDKNDHKQKQLRELALINGTLREEEFCPVCGEKGHRQFECPHRAKNFKAAGVKCSICGDLSHPTRDCPLKTDMATNEVALDSEYNSFIAELDGRSSDEPVRPSAAGPSEKMSAPATDAPAPPPRKVQKIIHVTTVLTGLDPPPMIPGSSGNAALAPNTSWAYGGYDGYGGYGGGGYGGYPMQPPAGGYGAPPPGYPPPPQYAPPPDQQGGSWRPPAPAPPPPPPE